jgi:ribose 5-phosphate isomerase B
MPNLKILIASDHAGYKLKSTLFSFLEEKGYNVEDVGTNSEDSVDYPIFALKLVEKLIYEGGHYGILICGTGVGMSIVANKFPYIRAANCSDSFTAKMARLHNNANVLCIGERVVGEGLAKDIAEVFLATGFEGGRHQKRVELIDGLAAKHWSEYLGGKQ